jgi:hypothetical protein
MAAALYRVLKAGTFAAIPAMAVNASAIRASVVPALWSDAQPNEPPIWRRWGEVRQVAGKPYDLQRATFYDIDTNAVTYANLSAFSGAHSDIRRRKIPWTFVSAAGLGG